MAKSNSLSPIHVKTTVNLLVERLTEAIIDGTYAAGDKIPPESELASIFGVGRNAVREAVGILISYGILEKKRPSGTYVCNEFKPQGINPFIYGLILQKDSAYEDLINLRKIFENGVLILLNERKLQPRQKQHLKSIHMAFEKAVCEKKLEDIIQYDICFHDFLSEITGNDLVIMINGMITKLTYASRMKTIEKILKKGDEQYLVDTHYNLMEKLDSEDIYELYQAIQDSYFYWKDVYKEN